MSILFDAIKRSQKDQMISKMPHATYQVTHPLSKSRSAKRNWLSLFFFFGLSIGCIFAWYHIKPENINDVNQWMSQRYMSQKQIRKSPDIELGQKVKLMQPKSLTPRSKPANFDELKMQVEKQVARQEESSQSTQNKSKTLSVTTKKSTPLSSTTITTKQNHIQADQETRQMVRSNRLPNAKNQRIQDTLEPNNVKLDQEARQMVRSNQSAKISDKELIETLKQDVQYDAQTLSLIKSFERALDENEKDQNITAMYDTYPKTQRGILQNYHRLPKQLQQELPTITINAHNFSSNPKKRFLIIGHRSIYEGQKITEDLQLIQVRHHDAVYSFHDIKFKAPALETWTVNK
tara:strand:+ start:4355 stop:5398 length:1044 start_codon:yes stop_codon:yes gene_type:complete